MGNDPRYETEQSYSINKMGEGLKSSLGDSACQCLTCSVRKWKWLPLGSSADFTPKRTKQRRLWTRLEVFIESQEETYTTIPYCSGHPTRTNNKWNWVKNDFASSSQFLKPPLVFTSHTSCLPVIFLSLKISHHKCPDSIDSVSSGFMAESLRFWIVQYKWLHGHQINKTTTNKQTNNRKPCKHLNYLSWIHTSIYFIIMNGYINLLQKTHSNLLPQ